MKNKAGFFVFFILVGYFLLGFFIPRIDPGNKFPFYNWTLFTGIPSEQQEVSRVIVKSINDQELNPPVFFVDVKDQISKEGRVIEKDYEFMKDLANAVRIGNQESINNVRNIFERNFSVSSVEYDLVRVSIDSRELWNLVFKENERMGSIDNWDFEVIESFRFEQ